MTEPTPPPAWGPPNDARAQAAAQKAYRKAQRNWFARHKILTGIGAVLVLAIIGGALGGGGKDSTKPTADNQGAPSPSSASAPAKTPASKPAPAGLTFPGKKAHDRVFRAGQSFELSGWTMTVGALVHRDGGFGSATLCAPVTLVNRDTKSQRYSEYAFKLQSPAGDEKDVTISAENNAYGLGSLAPGGKKSGAICFEDPGGHGLYAMSWQPDTFSSDARGVWLTRL